MGSFNDNITQKQSVWGRLNNTQCWVDMQPIGIVRHNQANKINPLSMKTARLCFKICHECERPIFRNGLIKD